MFNVLTPPTTKYIFCYFQEGKGCHVYNTDVEKREYNLKISCDIKKRDSWGYDHHNKG